MVPQDAIIGGLEPDVRDVLGDVPPLGEPASQGRWKLSIRR